VTVLPQADLTDEEPKLPAMQIERRDEPSTNRVSSNAFAACGEAISVSRASVTVRLRMELRWSANAWAALRGD
jgi:hypothetical protein